ncbi:aldose 1-epimerase family protein [Herbiconiux solani]|uniref:aldose 1-epimerase family protein n=1 Tax=Herbiconiux solani TaxID=661329 RepID=UPI000824F5C3|nr:aldose 1-epimerase family protein [Herbiconiux solani]
MSDGADSSGRPEGTDRTPVSGAGWSIRAGGYTAEIASVGASLRALRMDAGSAGGTGAGPARDLIVPFDADELRPALRGGVLAPWPNRLADGRYRFGGEEHQLPITEPELRTAAHGLVTWLDFAPVDAQDDRLVLSARIQPQPGYPWRVRVDVEFAVSAEGFTQRITATNESATPAPFGAGAHPYLVAGEPVPGAVDDWVLELPASEVLRVTADRLLPDGVVPVDGHNRRDDGPGGGRADGAFDFRRPRLIEETELNNAFTALAPDRDGVVTARLTGPDGHGVEARWPVSEAPWVQLYTADAGPAETRRHALALEPMTCPPDAFNSGVDLLVLEPGGSVRLEWMLRAV